VGKRAVYPGMFDPVHNGHLDVIERSLRIFDELTVAVVANPSKAPLFTVKERLEMIDEAMPVGAGSLRILSFDGLLIDLVARGVGLRVRVPDGPHEPQALQQRGDGLSDAAREVHVHLVAPHQGSGQLRHLGGGNGPDWSGEAPGRAVPPQGIGGKESR
jgi:cytidyltransferase-like protein